LIITYDGRDYQWDLDDTTIEQALAIEKYMGCSFAEWGERLQKGEDLRARRALGWLILHPDDGTAIEGTNFKLVRLGKALEEAFAAEAAQQAPETPGPTAAVASNGRKPKAAVSSPAS
jgi:hypothetical protein